MPLPQGRLPVYIVLLILFSDPSPPPDAVSVTFYLKITAVTSRAGLAVQYSVCTKHLQCVQMADHRGRKVWPPCCPSSIEGMTTFEGALLTSPSQCCCSCPVAEPCASKSGSSSKVVASAHGAAIAIRPLHVSTPAACSVGRNAAGMAEAGGRGGGRRRRLRCPCGHQPPVHRCPAWPQCKRTVLRLVKQ